MVSLTRNTPSFYSSSNGKPGLMQKSQYFWNLGSTEFNGGKKLFVLVPLIGSAYKIHWLKIITIGEMSHAIHCFYRSLLWLFLNSTSSISDMEVDKVADKVANMVADIASNKRNQKKLRVPNLARRRRVPNWARRRRVSNLARRRKKGYPTWWESWSRGLVNWAQTFSTQSLSDLCVF